MKHPFVFSLMLSLSFLCGSSQTPLFKSFKNVVIENELSKQKADFLKQHKKEYQYNKAQFETWIDGKTYIVATKNGNYSLFTPDGKPLLVHDNTVKWFPAILVEKHDGYTLYILYGGKMSSSKKGIASDLYGIAFLPEDESATSYEISEKNGEVFIKTADLDISRWPHLGGLYSLRYGKIFGSKEYGKGFAFNNSMTEGTDSITIDGVRAGFWHKPRTATSVAIKHDSRDGRLNYHSEFISPNRPMIHHKGYYVDFVPGYGVLSPSEGVNLLDENNGNFATVTANLGYPTSKMALVTTDGEILLDSISDITAIDVPGLFSYHKVIDDKIYCGLINLCNREDDVAPLFSDVSVEMDNGKWHPIVRTTLLAEPEKYDRTKKYEQKFAGTMDRYLEYASVDSLLKVASQVNIDTLSKQELIALSRGILRKYANYSFSQQLVLKHYSRQGDILLDDNASRFSKAFFEKINPKDFSKESTLMNRVIYLLGKYDESIADQLEQKSDILLGDLLFTRDSIIPQKKEEYLERSRLTTQEYQEIMRKTEDRRVAKEKKEQAERAARIQAWANAAQQWSDAYNAKQAAKKARPSSAATGKGSLQSPKGATSAGGSKADTTDRKIFLKGQIIDWKNKLKKAENSYRQALDSGGDEWQKQRVIESKRNTVNECLEMIRQFEAELNSL